MLEVIPNVLDQDKCYYLLKTYDPDSVEQKEVYFTNTINEYTFNGMRRARCAEDDLVKTISETYGFDVEGASVLKYNTGAFNPPHADNAIVKDGKVVIVKPWLRTAVLFLNDNFTGGELCYPNQGISIKPTVGTMVVASAGIDFKHYTNIADKERFVLVIRINN